MVSHDHTKHNPLQNNMLHVWHGHCHMCGCGQHTTDVTMWADVVQPSREGWVTGTYRAPSDNVRPSDESVWNVPTCQVALSTHATCNMQRGGTMSHNPADILANPEAYG